ncbi:hypothetical protein TrVE_jg3131 [Triparma verrucosa]|uniref:3-beta hydroxysteroid dehydrogenase/isomerase domain-containing protein n=1 Tax=Triparma verrucosa TaxID=1606542 RepID=A0A9W7BN05_9STRA|nr:hypothetical protein TrVE_jg3131 [Triparma verrucosa]
MSPGYGVKGERCMVTGSSGLVGGRLVEMLFERGAKSVTAFDLKPADDGLKSRVTDAIKAGRVSGKVTWVVGDLTKPQEVSDACKDVDTIYHIAALVGPFYPTPLYHAVNYTGTLNVIEGAKLHKVRKIVMSSSPSTRFTGEDIEGLTEDDLPIPDTFLQIYAETKALGEKALRAANSPDLMTIAVAPHQVYGPHDLLFLPNLLQTAGSELLRVFGNGENICSFCYVDNYCHGLMCGADSMKEGAASLGEFYIITDDQPQKFWHVLNVAIVAMGFTDIFSKFKLPTLLMIVLGYISEAIGWLIGKKLKLNVFSVKMLTIHRYFDIKNAKRDLGYKPIFTFEQGWAKTIEWFKENWLPTSGFQQKESGL